MNAKQLLRDGAQYTKRLCRTLAGMDRFYFDTLRIRTLTLGSYGAAWTYCPDTISSTSIVYSFGIGDNISFDLELIAKHGVTVNAFDPTPRSLDWIARSKPASSFHAFPLGLAGFDGLSRFIPPDMPSHVSFRAPDGRSSSRSSLDLPVRRLSTIMSELGHTHIDLLKMDIEGFEYEVIEDIAKSGPRIGQFLVEFHHRWPTHGIEKTEKAIATLASLGLRIFTVSPNGEDFGFINPAA